MGRQRWLLQEVKKVQIIKVKNLSKILFIFLFTFNFTLLNSAEKVEYLKTDWSFKGLFGKFDRGALQRGYQVYTEVCASASVNSGPPLSAKFL